MRRELLVTAHEEAQRLKPTRAATVLDMTRLERPARSKSGGKDLQPLQEEIVGSAPWIGWRIACGGRPGRDVDPGRICLLVAF